MKFHILQNKLKEGLDIVERVSVKSSVLPILNNALLKTEENFLEISTTNLETGIRFWILAKVEKEVIINGKKIPIKAKVYSLLSYSAHPDQSQLLNWIKPQTEKIKKIFLVQGELDALLAFKYKIINDLAIEVEIPTQNQIFSL